MSVQIEVKDRIAHVAIDNPPVNAVSQAVRQGLLEAATRMAAMPDVDGVVPPQPPPTCPT